jgi:methylated-DNA-[protein]-cysteine S-methyltransferase
MGQSSEAEARQALGMEGVSPEPVAWLNDAAELLRRFLDGEAVDINRIPINSDSGTPFQQKVRKAVRAIPPGETRTYGEIAKKVGSPGAARAVGRVMATNQVPLLVPCHRVVGSCGQLVGFSAPRGIVLKQHLLEIEQRAGGEPTDH